MQSDLVGEYMGADFLRGKEWFRFILPEGHTRMALDANQRILANMGSLRSGRVLDQAGGYTSLTLV